MSSHDAIVLGAGPAGATAALGLARAGWSVALVEKTGFPRSKVCGEFMSATNAPVFRELGLEAFIDEHAGPPIHRVGLFAGEDVICANMPGRDGGGFGRALGRDKLDAHLLAQARAAGATVWQPWNAASLERVDDEWRCRITRRGETRELSAPIVVAAHGSWDRGSLPTQTKRPHRGSDLLAFKAHFLDASLPRDLMPMLAFPGGYGGMATSDSGRVSLTFCIRRDVLERVRREEGHSQAAAAAFAHVARSCRGVREATAGAHLESHWLASGPIDPGIRKLYSEGLFRVGNCAGEAHPIVAEGLSMAMQSGWLLSRLLVRDDARHKRGAALAPVGETYDRAWRRSFAPRIRAAAAFAHLSMNARIAGAITPLVRNAPGILTLGARLSGKTRDVRVAWAEPHAPAQA